MALNINPDIHDYFYRYKMPKLITKVEGKGKTVIVNLLNISKALHRKPEYIMKYFAYTLGTQMKMDRHTLNGVHSAEKLQDYLYTFIRKFILCNHCENPETHLIIRQKYVKSLCKACGHSTKLDADHKLTHFIMKKPAEEN